MESVTCLSSCSVVLRYLVSGAGAIHGKFPLRRYLQQYAYFLKYSHSKALREDLYFMAQIIANDYVGKNNLCLFNDALYTIRKEYETYEMSEEYKADIAHNACILAGVLSRKLEHITSGAHAWKEFYEDSEQFRDVRNGYEEGIRMCKQQ